MIKDVIEISFPRWCNAIDKRIAANTSKNYAVGDELTIADIEIVTFLNSVAYDEATEGYVELIPTVENYEHLHNLN
jgi:glutathione S-transferase